MARGIHTSLPQNSKEKGTEEMSTGAVRFQKGDGIYYTVYGSYGAGLGGFDSITGRYCKARDYRFQEGEGEDIFCQKLEKRLARRHRWRKALGSIKSFFGLSKK